MVSQEKVCEAQVTFAPAASKQANIFAFRARYLIPMERKRDGVVKFSWAVQDVATLTEIMIVR